MMSKLVYNSSNDNTLIMMHALYANFGFWLNSLSKLDNCDELFNT